MSRINRRNFLRKTISAGGGLILLESLLARDARFQINRSQIETNFYGALSPVASANTGEVLLALPAGFQYNVFGKAGAPMTNSQPTPKLHDGMGVFDAGDSWSIVRNHEVEDFAGAAGTINSAFKYDSLAGGGTTTLLVNKATRLPTSEFVSLGGTVRNCSGGMTPWKTWLTCEETTFGTVKGFAKPHGYCFEIASASAPSNEAPVALKAMGRFRHESAAVDRRSGVVYLTEDYSLNSGFYRFVPDTYGKLHLGGKLQMLRVLGQNNFDTRANQTAGLTMLADWIDISEPDPSNAESNPGAVFDQGFGGGAAMFARLEGCFAEFDRVVFVSTTGGNAGLGQVWEYRNRKGNSGRLTLLYESPSIVELNIPDNIFFGPHGNIFLTEDNGVENHVRFLDPSGVVSDFAKNIVPNFNTFEFTGVCFSPSRTTMFVNIQTPGLTFAIWGPW